jgi:1-acyl-sn-glycerol-3-phosphate acyltransferase
MGRRFYAAGRLFGRFVTRQCLRQVVLHRERAARAGGYILACTHVSHIEPMIMSTLLDRPISWMARIEFYRIPILRTVLNQLDAFCVNRQGVPVSAIRTAINRAGRGEIVGIFPEGGCVTGRDLVFRGGAIKQGLCVVAYRAQVPIVPVVVLGTNHLNAVDPWLPGIHGRLWIGFGNAINPPPPPLRRDRKRVRAQLAQDVQREFMRLYQELLTTGVSDAMTP